MAKDRDGKPVGSINDIRKPRPPDIIHVKDRSYYSGGTVKTSGCPLPPTPTSNKASAPKTPTQKSHIQKTPNKSSDSSKCK